MSNYFKKLSKRNLFDYIRNNQSLISQSDEDSLISLSDSENGFNSETIKVKSGSERSFRDRVSVNIC